MFSNSVSVYEEETEIKICLPKKMSDRDAQTMYKSVGGIKSYKNNNGGWVIVIKKK